MRHCGRVFRSLIGKIHYAPKMAPGKYHGAFLLGWAAVAPLLGSCSGVSNPRLGHGGTAGSAAAESQSAPGASSAAGGASSETGGASGAGSRGEISLAPARVRRLNEIELRNSIADVFGTRMLGDVPFPVETQQGAFDNQFESLTFTQDFADALQSAAEAAGAYVSIHLPMLAACDPLKQSEAICMNSFVDTFGPRAYRRPVATEERARLFTLFSNARQAGDDYPTSISAVVEAMIQSPAFAFRTELSAGSAAKTALTPYEIASALSYFVLRTTPDSSLLDAARSGSLAASNTPGIEAEARRLLADPRAAEAMHDFFLQWLELTTAIKLTKRDPSFSAQTAASMVGETTRFLDTAWADPAGWTALLTSPETFVDANLAPIYGVASTSTSLMPIALDPTQRAGFLTHASFIAAHAPGAERSPIMLGHFVRTKLLCQALPPPPPGVPPLPMDASLDVVARYGKHESDPSCAGCHAKMDAIGFGWSQYDVVGRFSPVDHGVTEDGLGQLEGTDVDGPFHGPVELANKLALSDQVHRCFASMALSFGLGRSVAQNGAFFDAGALDRAMASPFGAGDLKALFVALVTSDAFLWRDTRALSATPGGSVP